MLQEEWERRQEYQAKVAKLDRDSSTLRKLSRELPVSDEERLHFQKKLSRSSTDVSHGQTSKPR